MTRRVERLCKRLGVLCLHLHGSVPVKRRPALIRTLEAHDGPAVFLSTDAGGVGLNLQAADAVVILDLPWNPARLEQRIARVHRIGSKNPVRILLIVGEDCIEDRILALHDTKRDVLENVWADDGENEIPAPGGSGAFKAMVRALLDRGPLPPEIEVARGEPTDGPEVVAPPPRVAERSPVQPETTQRTPRPTEQSSGKPRAPASRQPAAPDPGGIDLTSLGRAVAQVAPALPPEHRKSLATVFRALADALE